MPNTLPGRTIFDAPVEDLSIQQQRICGLYVLHGVNPMQVVKGSASVSPHEDGVKVSFLVPFPAGNDRGFLKTTDTYRLHAIDSVMCDHDGEPHMAVQRHSFVATWDEVAL